MFRNRGVTSKILVAGGVAALLATGVTGTASAWSGGDEAPLKVMTGFNGARSIAVGANDELYVPGYNNSTVAMFTAGWADGDTATNPGPAQVLTGGSGKSIYSPMGTAVDANNNLYVGSSAGIAVFNSGWQSNGNDALNPDRYITGGNTGLTYPHTLYDVAVGPNGKIYALTKESGGDMLTQSTGDMVHVRVFAADADGDASPERTFSLHISYTPYGIAVDANGLVYLALNWGSMKVFAADAAGDDPTPVDEITSVTGEWARGVAVDRDGTVYAGDKSGKLHAFRWSGTPGSGGTLDLIKTLSGANTGLSSASGSQPASVAVGTDGKVYVGTSSKMLVYASSYQAITFAKPDDVSLSQGTTSMSATASSGLAVQFSATTTSVCTTGGTNGAEVTLVAAGTCTIRATQAGNTDWNAAPSVDRSFAVTVPAPTLDPAPDPGSGVGPAPNPGSGARPVPDPTVEPRPTMNPPLPPLLLREQVAKLQRKASKGQLKPKRLRMKMALFGDVNARPTEIHWRFAIRDKGQLERKQWRWSNWRTSALDPAAAKVRLDFAEAKKVRKSLTGAQKDNVTVKLRIRVANDAGVSPAKTIRLRPPNRSS